jgi:hypothetical protein
MCDNPAYTTKTGRTLRYCTTQGCGSDVRRCQHPGCGQEFNPGQDGAARRRCAQHVTTHWVGSREIQAATCAIDGCETSDHGRRKLGRPGAWPYICATHRLVLRFVETRLKDHHVPWPLVAKLFDDSACPICGRDMLAVTLIRTLGSAVKYRASLVVDHDHQCCPSGAASCGQCVRGLICSGCNTALGHMGEDPAAIIRLAQYARDHASVAV